MGLLPSELLQLQSSHSSPLHFLTMGFGPKLSPAYPVRDEVVMGLQGFYKMGQMADREAYGYHPQELQLRFLICKLGIRISPSWLSCWDQRSQEF